MTQPAIKVEGLYKEYVVGHAREQHGTFCDLLAHSLKVPFKRLRNLGGQGGTGLRLVSKMGSFPVKGAFPVRDWFIMRS